MAIFVSLNPTYVSLLLFILMSGRGEESINISHDPELCCSEKQGRKRPLDTPKRMIVRKVEGEI